MQLITLTLVAPGDDLQSISPEVLADILWAHSQPADGFEHIRVAKGLTGIDISAFTRVINSANSGDRLRSLVRRAIATKPALSEWRIV